MKIISPPLIIVLPLLFGKCEGQEYRMTVKKFIRDILPRCFWLDSPQSAPPTSVNTTDSPTVSTAHFQTSPILNPEEVNNGELCSSSKMVKDYTLPNEGPFGSTGSPPGPHLVGLIEGLKAWTIGLSQFETPYAILVSHLVDVLNWNCAAVYSPAWKDALTGNDVLLYAPPAIFLSDDSNDNSTTMVELHNSDTRLICMASSWATVVDDWVPEASEAIMEYLQEFQYPMGVIDGFDPRVSSCFDKEGEADTSCLVDLAEEECYSPMIMGAIVGQQVAEYARRDGWNMHGAFRSDGTECTYNCRRYTDTTEYLPVYNATDDELKRHWSPLLEDNGRGYFTRQEHVAPHIGLMAKPVLLSREEMNAREVEKPQYDYDQEALLVTDRMANLTDEKKMLIEFFDDKIAVAFAIIGAVVIKGVSFEHVLNFVVGFTAAEYDAVLLAWKEKISHDLVRPTTWIQDQLGDTTFRTWVKNMGTQTIKGRDFEAYVRVMPHSEFVSGSGCIFQAIYEFTDDWIREHLNLSESMSIYLGDFPAGSSKTEPGLTPSEELNLVAPNMLELRNMGAQSRLDGGMHFTASIFASYALCEGVGNEAAIYASQLW